MKNPSQKQALSYAGPRERASSPGRIVRPVLLVLIVLLGAPVTLYLGLGLLLLVWSPFTSTVPEPEARANIASLAGGPEKLPGSLRVEKATRDDGPDGASYFYKLTLSPGGDGCV